jgi:hypothetical protein
MVTISIVTKVSERQTLALSAYEVITKIVHNVYGMEMLQTMLDADSLVSQTDVDTHAHRYNIQFFPLRASVSPCFFMNYDYYSTN